MLRCRLALAVMSLTAVLPPLARADVTCRRCDTVMHTDQPPQRCWNCGQPLFTPAPTPGGSSGPAPNQEFGPLSSGFELGVSFIPTARGIRVTRVKPDSAAAGVLFVNDIIAAAAYRDETGRKRQLPTRTGDEIETVKHLAGQSKTALMIRRPSGDVRFVFVSFRPVGGEQKVSAAAQLDDHPGVATRMVIDETGEAAELFDGPQVPVVGPQAGVDEGAADFFDRR
jgi:hypothetical protein